VNRSRHGEGGAAAPPYQPANAPMVMGKWHYKFTGKRQIVFAS
jgi:hypothetical protein